MAHEDALNLKSQMTAQQLSVLSSEMEKHKKSTGLTYVFWFFLGTLGIHKFYIGKAGMGVIYLLLGVAAWISLAVGVATGSDAGIGGGILAFIVLIAIVGIMLLIDLFTIGRQIRRTYENKELDIIRGIVGRPTAQ